MQTFLIHSPLLTTTANTMSSTTPRKGKTRVSVLSSFIRDGCFHFCAKWQEAVFIQSHVVHQVLTTKKQTRNTGGSTTSITIRRQQPRMKRTKRPTLTVKTKKTKRQKRGKETKIRIKVRMRDKSRVILICFLRGPTHTPPVWLPLSNICGQIVCSQHRRQHLNFCLPQNSFFTPVTSAFSQDLKLNWGQAKRKHFGTLFSFGYGGILIWQQVGLTLNNNTTRMFTFLVCQLISRKKSLKQWWRSVASWSLTLGPRNHRWNCTKILMVLWKVMDGAVT